MSTDESGGWTGLLETRSKRDHEAKERIDVKSPGKSARESKLDVKSP